MKQLKKDYYVCFGVFAHYCLAKYREFLLKFGSSLCIIRPNDVLTLDNPSIVIDTRRVYFSSLAQELNYLQVDNLVTDNSKKQVNFKNLPPTKLSIKITNFVSSDVVPTNENINKENQMPYPMAA